MDFRLLTTSIFYYYKVKDTVLSLLYALSSPFWLCLFYSVFNVFIPLCFRNFNNSSPFFFFVTSPYYPMFSSGLLAFPILELEFPTSTTSLAIYTMQQVYLVYDNSHSHPKQCHSTINAQDSELILLSLQGEIHACTHKHNTLYLFAPTLSQRLPGAG